MIEKASIIIMLCIALPLAAWSESPPPRLGEHAESSLDSRLKANQYSFDSGGIGISMSYGTKNGVSAWEIGDAFVKEMERRGVTSRYFFYHTNRDGMAIEFYIGYSAMGPWDVDAAASNVSKVVARAKAAKRVHGQ